MTGVGEWSGTLTGIAREGEASIVLCLPNSHSPLFSPNGRAHLFPVTHFFKPLIARGTEHGTQFWDIMEKSMLNQRYSIDASKIDPLLWWRESLEDSPFFISCIGHYPVRARYAELLQSSCDVVGKAMDVAEKPTQGLDFTEPEPILDQLL